MRKDQIRAMIAEGNGLHPAYESENPSDAVHPPDPAMDSHLEDSYDSSQNGDYDDDWQSRWDDDPSPYSGDWSEM